MLYIAKPKPPVATYPCERRVEFMKAMLFRQYGGVDKLRYEDVAPPSIGEQDVLVRVRACAINRLDISARQRFRPEVPLRHISGSDITGEIADLGRDAGKVALGDNVIVSPGISCGNCYHCLSGNDSMCAEYKIIGYQIDGGYAEFVKVPKQNVIPKAKHLKFEEAAAVPLVFLTAWHMMVTRAHVMPGEDVLVLGAGSGLGTAAVQVAKLHGARVIATAGTDEKLRKAKDLGADDVINHSTQDVAEEVRQLTGGSGVAVVIEHIGQATWQKSLESLAVGGRLVTVGATTGSNCQTDIRSVYRRQYTILGSYMGSKAELFKVLEFVNQGKLKPVVDRVFALREAAEAQKYVEERRNFGKVVLVP
jgi:NADPH:quinone reductase-like Zn-dependent oxidoreductase